MRWRVAFALVAVVFTKGRLAFADPPAVDVTVRGDSLLPRAEDPTVASSVVEGEALARPGTSATDALVATPSVRVSRTGSGADLATLGLRGATNAETPVYLAGVKLNDELSGTADLSTVPLFFLRRITVYRGNAPFDLPDVGLGGAVVFEPELPKHTRLGSGVGIGSFGERSAWVAGSAGTPRAAAALAVRLDGSNNDYLYTDDRGTRFDPTDDREVRRKNADATSLDAWAIGRVRLGERGSLTIVTNVMSREQGLTGLGVLPATAARATFHRGLFAVSARTRCEPDPRDDGCEVEASAYGKATGYLYRDPHLELPFGSVREDVRGEDAGYRVALRAKPAKIAKLGGGASQGFDLLDVDASSGAALRARRATSKAFVTGELSPLAILDFSLSASVASSRTSGPDGGGNLLVPEVRAGGSVAPLPELGFFADVARYERVPTLGERYGISASVLGNAALKPERGPSFEVGARYAQSPSRAFVASAEAVFFYRSARDLIAYRRTSLGILRPYNVGSAHVLGGEMTAAVVLFGVVRLDDALTLTDARDDTAGRTLANDALPFQAAIANATGIHVNLDRLWRPSSPDPCSIGTTLVYRGPRPADPAGLVALPRQLSWDVDAAVGFARGLATARVRISNLLDDRSTDAVGYPLPGRAGHVSVEAWWP